jgi:large subunit ribosomal protein L21
MSFAIFKTGGKQYKVQASEILKIEKLEKPEGENIEFNEILAYGNKENIELGSPIIKGAKIEAELLSNSKERTVLVFKKRRRKNSRRKYGHRQPFTLIRINKIFSKDGKILAEAEKRELKKSKDGKILAEAEKRELKNPKDGKILAKPKKKELTKPKAAKKIEQKKTVIKKKK